MKSELLSAGKRNIAAEKDSSATADDLHSIFAKEIAGLFRLALLLTGDAEEAETCLILAMRDCFKSRTAPKEQAHIWARRVLVRKAIQLILGAKDTSFGEIRRGSASQTCLWPRLDSMEILPESLAILDLSNFERFVFVLCVREGYDIQDCAQILGRSENDVRDALAQATCRIVSFEKCKNRQRCKTLRFGTYGSFGDIRREKDDACGTILD